MCVCEVMWCVCVCGMDGEWLVGCIRLVDLVWPRKRKRKKARGATCIRDTINNSTIILHPNIIIVESIVRLMCIVNDGDCHACQEEMVAQQMEGEFS